ncbi:non-ribosomal peptide synthetase [Ruegeria profundi]|nr:non-ribosomal peptide synthetase [Ruegeria profundi]
MGYPQGIADILPLSSAQKGMLFHVEGETQSRGQYVAIVSCTLHGPLNPQRLRTAMESLVASNDALRAGFVWKGVKQPVQVVQEKVHVPWTELDWTGHSDIEHKADDLLQREQLRQFDLKKPPLMAVTLIKTSQDTWRFVWTIHHLISDGWSTRVAFQEIFARYNGENPDDASIPSFKTYLAWLKKKRPLTDIAFWTDYLAGLDEPCLLPEPKALGQATTQVSHSESLGQDLMEQVEAVAASLKITPNTVLSAAWALVLRRQRQQNDVVFGTTTAGRPAEIPNISDTIGAFVSTLPVRLKIDPSQPVDVFLKNHARTEMERLKHEYAALADVQNCSPFPKGTPLFDTLFVNEGVQPTDSTFGEIQVKDLKTAQFSNYPLSLLVTPNRTLGVEVIYDPARVNAETARSCIAVYKQVLSAITADPSQPINDVMKNRARSVQVSPAPKAETVVQRFLHCAKAAPGAAAITDAEQTLSYSDLAARARQIAFLLREAGIQPSDIVPIALPRGADAIAAFLGVMMSGAAYVPLDLDYPQARLSQIMDTVKPRLVISAQASRSSLPETSAKLVLLEALGKAIPLTEVTLGPRAYVMFTSGSENKPKGVAISQAALAVSTAARDKVYGTAPEVYLLLSSLAFDSSVAGIYWTLCTGGHLVIASKNAEQRPAALGELISRHGVTHTLCLPGLAQAMLSSVPPQDLQSLKVLIAAGEALYPALSRDLQRVLPNCTLVNEYGPTEGTVWCTSFDATSFDGDQFVPIGKAIPGTWVGIFDSDGVPADPGVVGEIVVAGKTIADGYLCDSEQTKDRFFEIGPERIRAYRTGDLGTADVSGCITFLGRKDKQIKIRGHRVELSEIEATAQVVSNDRRVAALALDDTGAKTIALAVECPANDPVCNAVARHIEASLPDPLHPRLVVGIEKFPVLPNGKLDQNTLKSMILQQSRTQTGDAPRDTLEEQIAALFSETLKTTCKTRDANFFDLGGDSLSTIAAYTLGQDQGIQFEPIDLFSYPTVAELAKRVTARRAGDVFLGNDSTVQISNPGPGKTTVVIAHCSVQFSRYMARSLGPDHSVVHIPSHRTKGTPVPFGRSFNDLAAEAIAHMEQAGNSGPFVLCGYSAGCPMVLEMARQLGQQNILGLILLDPPFKMIGAEPALQPLYFRTYKRWRYIIKGWKQRFRSKRTVPEIKCAIAERPDAEELRIRGVEIAHELAVRAFRVPRLDKPAHIFLSQGNPSLAAGDALDTHLTDKHFYKLDMKHDELMTRSDVFSKIASVLSECTGLGSHPKT